MSPSSIPDPAFDTEHTEEDFANATQRYHTARDELLTDPATKATYDQTTAEITAHLEAKEATLAQVRRAIGLTQTQIAATLGMSQGDVSKLERRDNLHLATLARFIEATGGRLRICASYGDTEVTLRLGDLTSMHSDEGSPST